MKTIGGFFELEQPLPVTATPLLMGEEATTMPVLKTWPHRDGLSITNGRSALYAILHHTAPNRVYVPFYTCTAMLRPFHELGIPIEFYSLDMDLKPAISPTLAPDELFIVINYYGLCRQHTQELAQRYGAQLIVDNTQAFFEPYIPGTWMLNSARKYFGVPDGGFVYAPSPLEQAAIADRLALAPVRDELETRHLIERLEGNQKVAYALYQQAEQSQVCAMLKPSEQTVATLERVQPYPVVVARQNNFRLLHDALRDLNGFPFSALSVDWATTVPYCYPLLLGHSINRARFAEQDCFIPTYWPDVDQILAMAPSSLATGVFMESVLTHKLLPLPIDHRYDEADMARLARLTARLAKSPA